MDILNQFHGKINGALETFDRIIINGREYLSRMLQAEEIAYSMYNNSFSYRGMEHGLDSTSNHKNSPDRIRL